MALRITVRERDSAIDVTLEGRLAGPWVAELNKAWRETAPRLGNKTTSLNLKDLTYSDEDGKNVLKQIVAETGAEVFGGDPFTKHLAQEITPRELGKFHAEAVHGIVHESSCKSNHKQSGGPFSNMSASILEDLPMLKYPSSFPPNSVLFTEREPASALYVILEGEVRLSVNSRNGRRASLRIAEKGDVIGLSSALSGTPYHVTAETLCASEIAVIESREFLNFLAGHPDVYRSVNQELVLQTAIACSQLRNLMLSSSAQEKLARLLLDWSDRGQGAASGSHLRFSMTHEEVASCIGTSRETVARMLSNFKKRHLIAFSGSMMTILNRAGLAAYAHHEPTGKYFA